MTHALHLPADGDRVPFHADPVLAAIERHSEAWSVFQVAQEGEASEQAEDDHDAALSALLGTACATRAGMFCLIQHLRWFLTEEAPNVEGHGDAWTIAQAREADLSRCLGIERLPSALPSGRLIGSLIDLRPGTVAPAAQAAAALPGSSLRRTLSVAGEMVAALIIVAGGCGFVGFALIL